jgi:protein-tyrosine-phosphatase
MRTTKILFVCRWNRFRSKYAEAIFNKLNKNKNYKANSAGAIKGNPIDKLQKEVGKKYGITIKGSPQGLSSKLLKESDIIIVVANDVPANLFKDFKGHNKKLIIWNIPDVYSKNKIDIEKTILKIEKKVRDLIKKLK